MGKPKSKPRKKPFVFGDIHLIGKVRHEYDKDTVLQKFQFAKFDVTIEDKTIKGAKAQIKNMFGKE